MQLQNRLWRFNRRLDLVGTRISNLRALDRSLERRYELERLLMELQLAWEHFVRSSILDSATGRYVNSNGNVSSLKFQGLATRELASYALISTYKKRQKEPDWYLPDQAIQAADNLELSNYTEIATYLGTAPWVIEELRHVRNFIAHRSKSSAQSLRKHTQTNDLHFPTIHSYCFDYVQNGSERFDSWIRFMKQVGAGMVK